MSRATAADARGPAAPSGWLARAAAVVRRIIGVPDYAAYVAHVRAIGVPDYAAYVAHVRACHPGREPLPEREFLEERLTARYEKPGSRCC
jgi:uncharacterized short protein YbdD (DUF466 family)